MKKKFEHTERMGLPGGPNEMFTYVTGVFDIYQAPSNIEGEGMFAGKPFKKGDLIGLAHSNGQPTSQLGRMHNHNENSPTMISKKSGNDRFVFAAKDLQPGDELTTNYRMQPELEQPEQFQNGGGLLAKTMKCNSCGWKWKAADGGNDVTTCHKCGGEALPKAQKGREQATISQYEEPAWYEKAADYLASPMTALSYITQGKDLPDRLPINAENRNAYDMVIDMINPAAWYAYAESADRNISEGNYTNAAFDALGAIPVVPAWLSKGKNVAKNIPVEKLARNTPRQLPGSPNAFKSEIDWAKWNKEIPENKALMQEYNVIEQQAKANGSWMKNPDGSKFKGSPEQFVQQNSENFKKAFGDSKLVNPDGSPTIQYHGTAKEFDTFDPSKYQLGDSGYSGLGIYTTPNKVGAESYALSSAKFHTDEIKPTVMELYGLGKNPVRGHELPEGFDLFNFHRSRNYAGDVPIEQQLLNHDVAIRTQRGGTRIAPDHNSYENVFPTNTQLKSATGNNGMFDMTNPNIYKALAPLIGMGTFGAATSQSEKLPKNKYGGSLSKAQEGGEYKVKSGDTFYGIANKNNISKEDLIKANPGIDIQNLKLNQTIKFPVQDNVQDNVQKPEETSWSDYINPWNWGVSDRDNDGDFKQAFRAAREAGEDEFMWYGTRYTTDLKPTSAKNATVEVEKTSDKLNKAVKTKPFDDYKITPQLLYKQAFVESRLDPKAKNSLGYMGLGQIGEGVITDYKKATGVKEVDPFDPKQNHDIQEWSMNELYNSSFIDKPGATAENRLIKALASYNYGRGKVKDILEAEKAKGNDIYKSNDWTKQLPKETREYIDMIVYGGVTEKRPDVQTNFKKATEEDGYKDLRELYKYQSGGETDNLTIYKNYINGVYDNTPEENQAQKVYDKLNRVYYKEAKIQGTTVPNYIMSTVMNAGND